MKTLKIMEAAKGNAILPMLLYIMPLAILSAIIPIIIFQDWCLAIIVFPVYLTLRMSIWFICLLWNKQRIVWYN